MCIFRSHCSCTISHNNGSYLRHRWLLPVSFLCVRLLIVGAELLAYTDLCTCWLCLPCWR